MIHATKKLRADRFNAFNQTNLLSSVHLLQEWFRSCDNNSIILGVTEITERIYSGIFHEFFWGEWMLQSKSCMQDISWTPFVEQRNTGLSMNLPLAYRWLVSLLCNHFHVDFPGCSSLCPLFFLITQMLVV